VKYSPCTRAQHGVGHDIGVNFAGLAGVVLVLLGGPFLPHREPVCHPRLAPLAASAANFPDGRRAAGGRVFSRPSGSFRHAPLPHHRWPNRPNTPIRLGHGPSLAGNFLYASQPTIGTS
jgi:hypothetical protein